MSVCVSCKDRCCCLTHMFLTEVNKNYFLQYTVRDKIRNNLSPVQSLHISPLIRIFRTSQFCNHCNIMYDKT